MRFTLIAGYERALQLYGLLVLRTYRASITWSETILKTNKVYETPPTYVESLKMLLSSNPKILRNEQIDLPRTSKKMEDSLSN